MNTAPSPRQRLRAGARIDDRYRVLAFVAEGGMGSIYRAQALKRPDRPVVALKIMRPELASDRAAVTRFKREIEAVSLLQSPHTVSLFDFGQASDGLLFLAMEWLIGQDLAARIHQDGPLPPELATELTLQAAQSLAEAHDKGIVHRDLKLENLFLVERPGEEPLLKVLDFGLAKMVDEPARTQITKLGTICGTPEYMSPEQARGEALDGRSDVYALGCALYAMIVGEPPFTHRSPVQVVTMQLTQPVPELPLHLPAELGRIIQRATAKNRDDRYVDIHEMITVLEHFETHAEEAATLAAATAPTRLEMASVGGEDAAAGPTQRSLRTRAPRLIAAGLGACAVVGVGALWWSGGEGDTPSKVAAASSEPVEAPPAQTQVRVEVEPVSCRIFVDGKGQVRRPPLEFDSAEGVEHTLEIIPEDSAYQSQRFPLEVAPGVDKTVTIKLARKP